MIGGRWEIDIIVGQALCLSRDGQRRERSLAKNRIILLLRCAGVMENKIAEGRRRMAGHAISHFEAGLDSIRGSQCEENF